MIGRTFGIRVAFLRRKAGLSQEQAAQAAGMSVRSLGRIERGEIPGGVATLARLSSVLCGEPSELLASAGTSLSSQETGRGVKSTPDTTPPLTPS